MINDQEKFSKYLRRNAKNFQIEVVVVPNVCDCCGTKQGKDDVLEYLMSEPSEMTFTISFGGLIYENCRVSVSKDGKRMKWFNDKRSGVITIE